MSSTSGERRWRRIRWALAAAVLGTIGLLAPNRSTADDAPSTLVIAPLVGPQTFVVSRFELSAPEPRVILAELLGLLHGMSASPQEPDYERQSITELVEAGVREVWVVAGASDAYNFATSGRFCQPAFVVSTPPKASAAQIGKLEKTLGRFPVEATSHKPGIVFGCSRKKIEWIEKNPPNETAEFAQALAEIKGCPLQVVACVTPGVREFIDRLASQPVPATLPMRETFDQLARLSFGLRYSPPAEIVLFLHGTDAAAAAKLGDSARLALESWANQPPRPAFDKLRPLLKTQAKDARVGFKLTDKNGGAQAFFEIFASQRRAAEAIDAARKLTHDFRWMAVNMQNEHDIYKHFPDPAIKSKSGKPLLSWRVKLLPYFEQHELYRKFHLDEPWDSPHNKPLVLKMPACYAFPGSKVADQGKTVYQLPRGKSMMFAAEAGPKMKDITDGLTKTVMVVEVRDEQAVEWTRPDDWQSDTGSLRELGGHVAGGFYVAFADGSVDKIPDSIEPNVWRAWLTSAAGDDAPQPSERLDNPYKLQPPTGR